jgi:hypothetical protein
VPLRTKPWAATTSAVAMDRSAMHGNAIDQLAELHFSCAFLADRGMSKFVYTLMETCVS